MLLVIILDDLVDFLVVEDRVLPLEVHQHLLDKLRDISGLFESLSFSLLLFKLGYYIRFLVIVCFTCFLGGFRVFG